MIHSSTAEMFRRMRALSKTETGARLRSILRQRMARKVKKMLTETSIPKIMDNVKISRS